MASPTGLFYAYDKTAEDDWSNRFSIVFANRATADEWWRAVTDSVASGHTRFAGARRVTPQFYVHSPPLVWLSETLTDPQCAPQFLGRVFFNLVNDKMGRDVNPIPVLNYTDHISGRPYFIRSLLDRSLYWFYDGKNVVASRTHRTKFTITVQGHPTNDRELVMIGTDQITVNVVNGHPIRLDNGHLRGHSIGPLDVSLSTWRFSDLDGGFRVLDETNEVVLDGEGSGEPWELV